MSVLKNLLENLFGSNTNTDHPRQGFDNHNQYSEQFRNPIWQNDQEDDDEYEDDYRQSGPGFIFEVFTNPVDITRFFESEMEKMMKTFFSFGIDMQPAIENPQLFTSPHVQEKNLRAEVLKPQFALPSPDYDFNAPKIDRDLDGKIDAGDLSRIWKNPDSHETQPMIRRGFTFSSKSIVRHSDGTIEEKKTITDSEGNSETTIKRQIGDKFHTVIRKTDKNGVEIITENSQNLDESEIPKFESKWKPVEEPIIKPGTLSSFPWHKFFGTDPKL